MGIPIGCMGRNANELDRLIRDYASVEGSDLDLSERELSMFADSVYGKGKSTEKKEFKEGIEDYVELKSSFSTNTLSNYRDLSNVDTDELSSVGKTASEKLGDKKASEFIKIEGDKKRILSRMTSIASDLKGQADFFADDPANKFKTIDGLRPCEFAKLLDEGNPDVENAIQTYVEYKGNPAMLIPLFSSRNDIADTAIGAYVELKGNPDCLISTICNPKVGLYARRGLRDAYTKLGGSPEEFIGVITGHADEDTKIAAFAAYVWIKKDLEYLEKFLSGDENPKLTEMACSLYRELGGNPMKLVPLFDHRDPRVRNEAALDFGLMHGANPIHLVRLVKAGNGAALDSYVNLNGDPKELVTLMYDTKNKNRIDAIYAYKKLGDDPTRVTGLFKDADPKVRVAAIMAYGDLRGDPKKLEPLLTDKDRKVAHMAKEMYNWLGGDNSVLIKNGLALKR